MSNFNSNSRVKVRLTDLGKSIYYHRFDKAIAGGAKILPTYPDEDEHGYTTFPVWQFIEIYGDYVSSYKNHKVIKDNVYFQFDEHDIDNGLLAAIAKAIKKYQNGVEYAERATEWANINEEENK